MPGFVLVVLLVLAAVIGIGISNHRKKVGAAWATAAERLGLVHDPLFVAGASIVGEI